MNQRIYQGGPNHRRALKMILSAIGGCKPSINPAD
jgi:hypothetical protein